MDYEGDIYREYCTIHTPFLESDAVYILCSHITSPHNSWLRDDKMKRAFDIYKGVLVLPFLLYMTPTNESNNGMILQGKTTAAAVDGLDIITVAIIASDGFIDEDLVDQMIDVPSGRAARDHSFSAHVGGGRSNLLAKQSNQRRNAVFVMKRMSRCFLASSKHYHYSHRYYRLAARYM